MAAPRLLSEIAAAEHVGLPLCTFRAEVAAGNLPAPVPLVSTRQQTRPRRYWDRAALDRRLDEISGIGAKSDTGTGMGRRTWR